MSRSEDQDHLVRVARHLHVPLRGDVEAAVKAECLRKFEAWSSRSPVPPTLDDLLAAAATSVGLTFEEVWGPEDIDALLRRFPPNKEPGMLKLKAEFDEDTDAVMIQRLSPAEWEQPFMAVINCAGWHGFRRYFSKWHEVAHLLLEGAQLQLAFRRTARPELGRDRFEALVDAVAGDIAFWPAIFVPAYSEVIGSTGRLSFRAVDEIRGRISSAASREATLLAALKHYERPAFYVRCRLGYRREELRQLEASRKSTPLPGDAPTFVPRLRVQLAMPNPSAERSGIRFHVNMRVPAESVISHAYADESGTLHDGTESLTAWTTSSGNEIGRKQIDVEAARVGEDVLALVLLRD